MVSFTLKIPKYCFGRKNSLTSYKAQDLFGQIWGKFAQGPYDVQNSSNTVNGNRLIDITFST